MKFFKKQRRNIQRKIRGHPSFSAYLMPNKTNKTIIIRKEETSHILVEKTTPSYDLLN